MSKHTLELHYSIRNGGDGSAYPYYYESAELAEWDQELQNEEGEGWGESCTGCIPLESDSPITVKHLQIHTKDHVFCGMVYDEVRDYLINQFIEQFYPEGVPTFTLKEHETSKHVYYILNGEEVAYHYAYSSNPDELLERLNSYSNEPSHD